MTVADRALRGRVADVGDGADRGAALLGAEALAGDGTAKGHKQEANPGVYGVDEARGAEAPEENVPSYTDAAVDDPLR